MRKLQKILLLVLTSCILLQTQTLVSANTTTHYKVRASGVPLLIEWHETRYENLENQDVEASFSLEAVENPAGFSGQFKIRLVYSDEDIFLKATGRVSEIYEEGSEWGDRRVFNGDGLVIEDSEKGKYNANFQARVYEEGFVSIDVMVDDKIEVWIPGVPIERSQVIEGKDFEEKLEEKLEKIEEKQERLEEKLEEKQDKLEEKFDDKQEKLEEKEEKLNEELEDKLEKMEEKQEKLEENSDSKREKLEEKYEDKTEKLEEKLEKLEEKILKEKEKLQEKQEKLEEKRSKEQEKLEEKQEKLEEKYDKKQEKLEEKMAKEQEKLEEKQEKLEEKMAEE